MVGPERSRFCWIGVSLIILALILPRVSWATDHSERNPALSYTEIFSSPTLAAVQKWAAATNQAGLTEHQRAELHALIVGQSDARYYAVTALAAARDAESVSFLGRALVEQDFRYCALALGLIGHTNALPFLIEALRESHPEYVQEDARIALRMLNYRLPEDMPAQTLNAPASIHLGTSKEIVRLGEDVELQVEVKNLSDRSWRIAWGDVLCMSYVRFFSPEGHIFLPASVLLEYQPSMQSFPKVEPQSALSVGTKLSLELKKVRLSNWGLLMPEEECVMLMSQDGSWGMNLGPETTLLPTSIVLAIDYQPVVHPSVPRRFNISPEELLQARVVSNPITIQLFPASSDP